MEMFAHCFQEIQSIYLWATRIYNVRNEKDNLSLFSYKHNGMSTGEQRNKQAEAMLQVSSHHHT
jgi:hypothetical protein